ncbi:MAG: metallophosphoesterase [Candidatus Diapherotrites archaeon]|nr:metallophosphoesterase [Candidatus Diapherotrites archaeon]
MKFVIIADIHFGPEAYWNEVLRKINKNVIFMLGSFVEEMNTKVKPDFVIVLGDLIEDENEENDKKNITYIVNLFTKLNCPVYYAAGNHDLMNISESDLVKLFNQKSLYYSFDSDNMHFVVLYSKRIEKGNVQIIPAQLKWLEKDLKNNSKKSIIFVHHGLAEQDLKGNPWFEGRPEVCLIRNREEVRKVLENSKNVLAVFNAHLHWDKKHIHNNIPYFTIQSLVENEEDKGMASEAYAIVNTDGGKVGVEVKGKYPKKLHV